PTVSTRYTKARCCATASSTLRARTTFEGATVPPPVGAAMPFLPQPVAPDRQAAASRAATSRQWDSIRSLSFTWQQAACIYNPNKLSARLFNSLTAAAALVKSNPGILMATVHLALGSNVGDRAAHLDQARLLLAATGVTIERMSSYHE